MPENRGVHAPYNFVPFSSKILFPYRSVEELPSHDRLLAHLKSGEIQVKICAETPVFVSDGDKNHPHFFRGADGKFMIPGSTVRGMARENMQILGFGLVRPGEDLEDYQIYFREMTAAKGSVGEALKKYYRDALDIQSRRSAKTGKTFTIPQNVASGYLFCRNGSYCIRPTAEPFMRVSRKMEDVQCFGSENARIVPVSYQATDGIVKRILPAKVGTSGMKQGVLLYTGRPVGKPNHLYLFPSADSEAQELPVPPEDILSYRVDLESRANSLKAYYPISFWDLPKEGEEKPVFYVRFEGHLYFGMSMFLRIGYRNPLSEGLPKRHRDIIGRENCPLDYPHAILGFSTSTDSYRSRVSFGDFHAVGEPREQAEIRMILGAPKPSYYPGYVVGGKNYNEIDPGEDDDQKRFQLRGYKQYWLKQEQATAVPEGKEKVGTAIRPLPIGTAFQGIIRFQNLTEMELGLLLWSLRLEDECFQTIGMGKPYGYGRMKLQITSLRIVDPALLYCGDLTTDPWTDETDQILKYIDAYDKTALGTTGKKKKVASVRNRPEIKDFFFIKRTIRIGKNMPYMELPEYQNVRDPLPTIRSIRQPMEEEAEATSAIMDPYEALREKYKRR